MPREKFDNFQISTISPIHVSPPAIAAATLMAGGTALLDREFCHDDDIDIAEQNLVKLLSLISKTSNQSLLGLRLRPDQIDFSEGLLTHLNQTEHQIVICGWTLEDLPRITSKLPQSPSRQVLLEVTCAEQVRTFEPQLLQIDGWIARGQENGGWVGDEPTFILFQKVLGLSNHPVYLQGGVGLYTTAACRAAGASGVIVDDQLWLMPESPLPKAWQKYLTHLNGQEAISIGERVGSPIRVLSRPGFNAVRQLQQLAEEAETAADADEFSWKIAADQQVGWGEPGETAWPMGQGVGLAAMVRDQYHTTGRYLQALQQASLEISEIAQQQCLLRPGAPLAMAHQTTYPIVQGPMTRVSDTAEFANAVSEAGALPLLALALMRRPKVEALLQQAKTMLAGRAWGIGILGFVPQALKEEQLAVIEQVKPPFALIAGGRPDQAARLEKMGIATYIHVPTPQLLHLFLQQGARRFVFEGRECGGHVGPLSSFVLWESIIETLLREVPPGDESQVHVLFAGGIHDALSAAMISVMAAPLAKRGMKVGVLMGTAYLFTQEAVACGAIVEEYQRQAIACHKTINLETGPGHASRCAVTPFAEEFYVTRRRMLTAGRPAEEVKNTLEELTLGRLRVASKGIVRNSEGLTRVPVTQQLTDGMYMIGQVATLREQSLTLAELHQDVSTASTEKLRNLETSLRSQPKPSSDIQPSDIAIIGMSTLLPKAQQPDTFWENILSQVNAITEIPAHRWDWRLYYDSNRHARDKVYSKWGGFLDDVPFDPLAFGIPPNSLKSIEPMQLLALEAVRRALVDAGKPYEQGDFDRENTCVILGASGGMADLGGQYATRAELPRMATNLDQQVWERLPEWTEESFPGLLMNVIAGRVANRFDFGGANFTVDAACGSSLAAIDLAVKELESGRSQIAIAGGVDLVQSPFAYFCFSKTQALSPRGQARTFDKSADGIVISEGVAMVVLKRLEDAQRDGDRIYATIKAVASSSDGKGLSMTAPATSGQKRAFHRAYQKAGFSPNTIGLYEAHGTGTVAGDQTELSSITSLLQEHHASPKSCAIGSVKTILGHTKSTAGVTALVKAALSLHHQVLPPHSNVEQPLDTLSDENSPVYLLQKPQPWLHHPHHPRRAALSAFGFGGTNFHAVLEEYQGGPSAPALGAKSWPWELIALKAANRDTLLQEATQLKESLLAGAKPRLRDLAYSYAHQAKQKTDYSVCVSLVVEDLSQLIDSLTLIITHLRGQNNNPLPPHIQVSADSKPGKIAFLFPGQVAQYPGMARDVALYFPEMRAALEKGSQQLRSDFPKSLEQYIYPPSAYSEAQKDKNKDQLTNTHVAQPIIGTVEAGYIDIAARLGLTPDMTAGHSYGEYAALHAAGVLDRKNFLHLSERRGRVMDRACEASDGAMAAVQATREELLTHLEGYDDVTVANHNAPLQAVISGKTSAVRKVVERLQVADIMARMLPVAGAFHSSLVESAQISLAAAIDPVPMQPPQIPVYSNTTACPYDPDVEVIREQLARHLLSPVEFVAQINAMYQDGARTFLELGPKSIMTRLVSQILEGREHTAVPMDGHRNLQGFLIALGTLFVKGVNFDLIALFQDRDVRQLNLSQLNSETPLTPTPNRWLINGGGTRPQSQNRGYTGTLPPLTQEAITHPNPLDKLQLMTSQDLAASNVSGARVNHPFHTTNGTMNANSTMNGHKPAATSNGSASIFLSHDPSPSVQTPNSQVNAFSPVMTSQLQQQPTPEASAPTMASGEVALTAYQAYQQTMRQFLGLQEKVMHQFLQGGGVVTKATNAANSSISTQPSHPTSRVGDMSRSVAATPATPPSKSVVQPQVKVEAQVPQPAANVISPTTNQQQPRGSLLTDRASLLQTLINLVSDRTGYPPDMLGLDQDMEAELGIDSIKRVEIFTALQAVLPEDLAASVKGHTEQFTKVKTLNGLVDNLLASAPASAAPATNHHQPGASLLSDRDSLLQTLVNLVSDRTGYPPEMLGLDQDMEAELGIDSIKRVEIFTALQAVLPEGLAASVKGRTEQFTKVKTLNGLVDALLTAQSPASQEGSNRLGKYQSSHNAAAEQTAAIEEEPCQRYLTQGRLQPLPADSSTQLSGLFLLTADSLSIAPQLREQLEQRGASAALLPDAAIATREHIAQAVAELRAEYGPVTGIIHLAGLGEFALPDTLNDFHPCVQTQSKSLFHLLQLCEADLRQSQGQVLAASLLGGHWGREGNCGPGLPLGGSSNGLLKTMVLEWPEVRAKVIDFDQASAQRASSHLLNELLHHDEGQEIGYVQGKRTIFSILPAPLGAEAAPTSSGSSLMPVTPEPDWVVLSIGGARGITAEIVTELVVPGMTLILVGRSPLPEDEATATQPIEDDVNTLRTYFIQQARSQGAPITPVEIDKQIQGLQRNRAIRQNLAAFQQAGVQVHYIATDVTQADAVASLLEGIYERYGRLDAIVQGAGLIQDKLLSDKVPASFDRVFDTKVNSTYLLSRYLRPESLKLMVLFASIAGRTGNRGQCDYAAANEVVNRFGCWMARQWPHTRVMAINWGPWDVTGMASEAVNRQFRERGVIPIAPAAGRRFFRDELNHGDRQAVELIAGTFQELSPPENTHPQGSASTGFPLLLALPQMQPDSTVTVEQTLSLAAYPFLSDHRIDGKPVVAAACALELLAEFVQAAWLDWVVCEAHDLRVLGGIVLRTEAGQSVQLKARASTHADAMALEVVSEIVDIATQRVFYRVKFILRPQLEATPAAMVTAIKSSPGLEVATAYRNYCFHGPQFQLLTAINCFNEQGIQADVTPSLPSTWLNTSSEYARSGWLFDPGLVDVSLQMGLMWTHVHGQTGNLPSRFGRVVRYGAFQPGQPIEIEWRVKRFDAGTMVSDALFIDGNRQVLLQLEDMEVTCSQALNRLVNH